MTKKIYDVIDKYVDKTADINKLYKMILEDKNCVKEFKNLKNIVGEDNIKKEINLVLDAYPHLKSKFGIW